MRTFIQAQTGIDCGIFTHVMISINEGTQLNFGILVIEKSYVKVIKVHSQIIWYAL